MFEIETDAPVVSSGGDLIVDFGDRRPALSINGIEHSAPDAASLAQHLRSVGEHTAGGLLSMPFTTGAESGRLIVTPHRSVGADATGCHLIGAAASATLEKASRLASDPSAPWPEAPAEIDESALPKPAGSRGFPMIVSMPRTGSTLLGTSMLLLRDPPGRGDHVFSRYLHEPVAPVFWQARGLDAIAEITGGGLGDDDVVQESAYQFTAAAIAAHFLRAARPPVIFLARHPQLAWPSRWRVLLKIMRADPGRAGDHARIDHALDSGDFQAVGEILSAAARPLDNGWVAFLAMISMCLDEGIDHVVVTNDRFRDQPGATMQSLCELLGVAYDPAVVTWRNLSEALPRVVMGPMAREDEYEWYYSRTLGSQEGILRADDPLVDPSLFPPAFRGVQPGGLTIDDAVTCYQSLLSRPEVLA
jgi:hypothetical protein